MFYGQRPVLAISLLTIAFCLVASRVAVAEDVKVVPKGEYAKIDVRLANETMKALAGGTAEERRKAIETIQLSPQKYAPPVFFLLSNVLFQGGKQEEGAFWFYAGQLRARFDANRCADISAREAVGVLNQEYGSVINQFMFKDLSKLEELIPKVVEWDRKTPHDYDHRWINLHGMGAMMSGLDAEDSSEKPAALSLSEEQWGEIAEKTRADYLAGFKEALARMKTEKK
jgi:hypothetical protein